MSKALFLLLIGLVLLVLLKLEEFTSPFAVYRDSPLGAGQLVKIRNSRLFKIGSENPSGMKLLTGKVVPSQNRRNAAVCVAPLPDWNRDAGEDKCEVLPGTSGVPDSSM